MVFISLGINLTDSKASLTNRRKKLTSSKSQFFIFLQNYFINIVVVVYPILYCLCHKCRVDAPVVWAVRSILLATAPMLRKMDMVGVFVDGDLLQRVDIAPTSVGCSSAVSSRQTALILVNNRASFLRLCKMKLCFQSSIFIPLIGSD